MLCRFVDGGSILLKILPIRDADLGAGALVWPERDAGAGQAEMRVCTAAE